MKRNRRNKEIKNLAYEKYVLITFNFNDFRRFSWSMIGGHDREGGEVSDSSDLCDTHPGSSEQGGRNVEDAEQNDVPVQTAALLASLHQYKSKDKSVETLCSVRKMSGFVLNNQKFVRAFRNTKIYKIPFALKGYCVMKRKDKKVQVNH